MGSQLHKELFRHKDGWDFWSTLEIGGHYMATLLSDYTPAGVNWLFRFNRGVPNFKWIWMATCRWPTSIPRVYFIYLTTQQLPWQTPLINQSSPMRDFYLSNYAKPFAQCSFLLPQSLPTSLPLTSNPHSLCPVIVTPITPTSRKSQTLTTKPGSLMATTVHVDQIADYVNFDNNVRVHGGMLRI